MSRYLMCPNCGHRLSRAKDDYGDWDGETYTCDWCSSTIDEDDADDGEALSAYDAALIWLSNGRDEDYTFGYSEEELEEALR